MFQNCRSLYPDSKSVTCELLRIVANISQDVWVDHAGAEDLEPSALLADAATLAGAQEAGYVHFEAWFGKGKKAGAKLVFQAAAVKCTSKSDECPLQLAEAHVSIDVQPLDLVKKAVAPCADRLIPIDAPRHNDA